MYVAILAGGVGTRLWPRSRQSNPKQFSDITGSGRTMIQATADRLADFVRDDEIYVITGERYADLTATQLPQIPTENIIVEPSGRNTAPAIGLACVHLYHRDPEAVIAIVSADHVITDDAEYQASLKQARATALQDYLVTIGIEPDSPHTGFGYIKRSDEISLPDPSNELPAFQVDSFLEKPDLETAKSFLAEGGYYWNGGYFIFTAKHMLAEIERQMPEMYALLMEVKAGLERGNVEQILAETWPKMPSESIDYAIAEGAQRVAVVPLRTGWHDIGSWEALETVRPLDDDENCVARGEITTIDSKRNVIYSEKMVALIGIDDIVVVETEDALLIGKKDQMQEVKQVVEKLKTRDLTDLL